MFDAAGGVAAAQDVLHPLQVVGLQLLLGLRAQDMKVLGVKHLGRGGQQVRAAGEPLQHLQLGGEHEESHSLARRQFAQELQHLPAGINLIACRCVEQVEEQDVD